MAFTSGYTPPSLHPPPYLPHCSPTLTTPHSSITPVMNTPVYRSPLFFRYWKRKIPNIKFIVLHLIPILRLASHVDTVFVRIAPGITMITPHSLQRPL